MINNQEYLSLIDDVFKVVDDFSLLKNKNILIIGSTGTIGSFLVDTLMRRNQIYNENITIYAGSRTLESIEKRFKDYLNNDLFIPYPFDITKSINIDFHLDYIVHAGSDSYPKSFQETPVEIMQSNFIGTNSLLNYCKDNNTRFLYISSGEVYGQYSGTTPIKEDYQGYVDNLKFRSCYPVSKRASETLCISYQEEYHVDVVIARLSHVYSPYYKEKDNKIHIKFIESALNHQDIIFKRGVKQVRSYTFIVDAITGLLKVLLSGISGEAYNISNENSVIDLEEMAEVISKIANTRIIYEEINNNDACVFNPMNYAVLDNQKLKALNWHGMYNFQEGIEKVISIRKRI